MLLSPLSIFKLTNLWKILILNVISFSYSRSLLNPSFLSFHPCSLYCRAIGWTGKQ